MILLIIIYNSKLLEACILNKNDQDNNPDSILLDFVGMNKKGKSGDKETQITAGKCERNFLIEIDNF